jgi:hypothetical protein
MVLAKPTAASHRGRPSCCYPVYLVQPAANPASMKYRWPAPRRRHWWHCCYRCLAVVFLAQLLSVNTSFAQSTVGTVSANSASIALPSVPLFPNLTVTLQPSVPVTVAVVTAAYQWWTWTHEYYAALENLLSLTTSTSSTPIVIFGDKETLHFIQRSWPRIGKRRIFVERSLHDFVSLHYLIPNSNSKRVCA